MSKKPFISIGIASYNYAQFIYRGFNAIRKQQYTDLEVVYCDDASTDSSVEVIKKIITENPDMNIRLLQNDENMGLLKTKDRLIHETNGVYLMLCDADDWMAEGCLMKLAQAAVTEKADRVVSEVCDINEQGKLLQVQDLPHHPSKWLWNIHHGCLYRHDILIEHDIHILYEPDDVYLITKFNQYCKKTVWIHERLYYWYVHQDSYGRKTGSTASIVTVESDFQNVVDYIEESCRFQRQNSEQPDKDILLLELLLIKVYYLQLFHTAREYSITDKWKCYEALHKKLQSARADYLCNPFLKIGKKSPMRGYATRIIRLSALLEKMHMMKMGLLGYHILGKVIYFDQ